MNFRIRILLIALMLTIGTSAHALLLEYTLDQMVESSESIVQGRVLDLESRWLDGPGSIIVTDVKFQIGEVLAGKMTPRQELSFYVIGGFVDGMGMRQEHQPVFREGEESFLFLWTQPDEQRVTVFNDEQGRYRIVGDSVINFKREARALTDFREDLDRAIRMYKR